MNIVEIIYSILSTNTAITDIVGTNISPIMRHESGNGITFQEIDAPCEDDIESNEGFYTARWQINCWTSDYDTTKTLTGLVRAAIKKASGAGIDRVTYLDRGDLANIDSENEELQEYGKRIEFEFYYKE